MIAMALALEPEILIADEPTTALDVIVTKAQILDSYLKKLQQQRNMAMILISHDLNVVKRYADEVLVLNQGTKSKSKVTIAEIFHQPKTEYTRKPLLNHDFGTGTSIGISRNVA
jgi:microcin C transport system ATP-binding protein